MTKKTPVPPDDLNVILFGPPGTGKTYDTIRRAVHICDGQTPADQSAIAIRFRQLQDEGRIEFVTFHQSYGYEDFVEGIRPVLEQDESPAIVDAAAENQGAPSEMRYECRPGILKTMCALARSKSTKQSSHGEIDLEKINIWKMSLGDTQDPDDAGIYDECIANNYLLLGYGKGLNFEGCSTREQILAKLRTTEANMAATNYHVQSMDVFRRQMAVGDLVVISDGNRKFRAVARVSGPYKFLDRPSYPQTRPVEWLTEFDKSLPRDTIYEKNFSQMTLYSLRKKVMKLGALKQLITGKSEGSHNHVLIIDEINRGNISKILGELITLLEPDKRLGAENELTVTLPYSREEFGVPANLYVVGTMNTADRSIAFLDVALRRRFQFIELMPNPDLIRKLTGTDGVVDGINVAQFMVAINDRIELLYDRDHQIGHSFFLNITSLVQLRDALCRKVIPLLQEYFYGDWTKVCFVLGCPFDESGKPATQNSHPIIQTRILSAGNLPGGAGDSIEDKVRCDVHPDFMSASASADLQPFFKGVLGTSKAT